MATVTLLGEEDAAGQRVAEHDTSSPGRFSPLTLAALLSTAPLRAASPRVLCAANRLDTPIRWVHAGEVPEIASLLRGGEVLLTTGIGIGPRAADQRRFIDTLAAKGVVGVVLELGSAIRSAPEALVARAAEHEIPLVVLERTVRFVDVTEVAHRRILSEQLGSRRRVECLHRELVSLVLDGADTASLLESLAQRVGIALSLVRSDGQLLFHAPAAGHSRQDMLDAHARALLCRKAPVTLPVPCPGNRTPIYLMLPCQEGPLGGLEAAMLRRGCDLLALSLQGRRQEETLLVRENGEFLSALMNDELSEHEAETRALELGWIGSVSLLPLAVAGRTPQQVRKHRDRWGAVVRDVQQQLATYGIPMIGGLLAGGDAVGAIVGVPEPRRAAANGAASGKPRRAEIAGRVAKAVRTQVAQHLAWGDGISLCVGEAACRWTEVGEALREVVDLTPTSLPSATEDWIDLGRLHVDLLITRLLGNEALERFVLRRLEPLEVHDQQRKSELIRTLEALFDHNGNKTDTARALFLERQSLYSRLERIEELLGESLEDSSTRLGLHLALHVRRSKQRVRTL
jgi:purine catabolism regulator